METFKISLASARKNANMTQRAVASALHKNVKTIVSWENGKTVPSITDAIRLSDLYKIPISNLSFLCK